MKSEQADDPRVDEVQRRLAELPSLRCPDHVVAAAERAAPSVEPRRRSAARAGGLVGLALAASLALAWVNLQTPEEPPVVGSVTAAEAERLLAELDELVRIPTADAGRRAIKSGFAKPARTVIDAVADSQLGRWGTRAASLFDRNPADAS